MPVILFIIDTLNVGGAERSLLEITSRFTKYKPVFVQLFEGEALLDEFNAKGVEVVQLKLKPSYAFRSIAKEVYSAIRSYNPVLIHTTLFRSDMVGRYLTQYLRVPLVASFVNNSYSKQRYRNMSLVMRVKLAVLQAWDRFTCSRVNAFISNSESIKKSNSAALGIPLSKIHVIYRGRNPQVFSGREGQARPDSGKSPRVFLNVSRLLERKGQLDLIHAFKNLLSALAEQDAVELWIAGEGPYRSTLEASIKSLSLENSVRLLGTREDIPALLKEADFFVFPSHYEGLPGSLLEAMFSGTPILASSIPENRECVDERMALLFPAGDRKALTHAMQAALTLPDWESKTQGAQQFALSKFDIARIPGQYEHVYNELIDAHTTAHSA